MNLLQNVKQCSQELEQEKGRKATAKEIAETLNLEIKLVRELLRYEPRRMIYDVILEVPNSANIRTEIEKKILVLRSE